MEYYRHTWMSTSLKSKKVCTRCGAERHYTNKGVNYYVKGVLVSGNPYCKPKNNEDYGQE